MLRTKERERPIFVDTCFLEFLVYEGEGHKLERGIKLFWI